MLLRRMNLRADTFGGVITLPGCSGAGIREVAGRILGRALPSGEELAADAPDTEIETFDYLVPEQLRRRGWAARYLDVPGAAEWLGSLVGRK